MTGKTHVIGGLAFGITLFKLSNIDTPLQETLIEASLFTLGTLLPDVDYPNTLINKYTFNLPFCIFGRYGHRTLTHSLLFLLSTLLVTQLILSNWIFSVAIGTGILTHLLLDTLTPLGVPYMYPFIRTRYSVANVHTGSLGELSVILCCWLLGYVLMYPREAYLLLRTWLMSSLK